MQLRQDFFKDLHGHFLLSFFFLGGGGPQAVLLLKCEEKLECCFSS
jgi:hypothetical protein